jgi:acetyl-CoA C-acetyltransferase
VNGKAVVLSATRTPFGRLGGALASLPATTLGAEAIRSALERAKADRAEVEHVIMGQVLQGGAGQAPARQASYKAGLAKTVTSETLNKVCASGMLAVAIAARLIDGGDYRLIVAGGMESMSNAPYALPGARSGYRFGDGKLVDLMIHDGLWDFFFDVTMASQGAKVAEELGLTREMQDEFALRSHQRATAAQKAGWFDTEMVPLRVATKQKGKIVVDRVPTQVPPRVPVLVGGNGSANSVWSHTPPDTMVPDPQKYSPYLDAKAHGEIPSVLVDRDEAVRTDASLGAMAKLPAIDKGGSVTAGNAPGVNDGAAALVLADPSYAKAERLEVLATIVDHATAAWDPPYLALTPAMAAQKLLDRHGLSAKDIAAWEINEAFSAVVLSSAQRLGVNSEDVNAQGGAVAMGHPIGASGARITGTLIHQLRRRGGGLGIAAICSGGGQGDALLVRVE